MKTLWSLSCILRLLQTPGADPGFLEGGSDFKVWGFALLVLSHFS